MSGAGFTLGSGTSTIMAATGFLAGSGGALTVVPFVLVVPETPITTGASVCLAQAVTSISGTAKVTTIATISRRLDNMEADFIRPAASRPTEAQIGRP